MKLDIILAGVGGQGILTIAKVFGQIAVKNNMFLKQAEVHGMSQRGGDVQSNLRISDKEIYSDLIPEGEADLIISVEPMEGLRYLPLLAPDGWLITNAKPFVNIPNYPEIETVYGEIRKVKNHILIDAEAIAKELGNVLASNIVMLGAAAEKSCFSMAQFEKALNEIFGSKGEAIVDMNIKALRAGNEAISL
jgi:indolepyruvate ferredoxin oxidoreductase beta subunit